METARRAAWAELALRSLRTRSKSTELVAATLPRDAVRAAAGASEPFSAVRAVTDGAALATAMPPASWVAPTRSPTDPSAAHNRTDFIHRSSLTNGDYAPRRIPPGMNTGCPSTSPLAGSTSGPEKDIPPSSAGANTFRQRSAPGR